MGLQPLFQGIADAIREKDGTANPIVAETFPARIQAIPVGIRATTPYDPAEVYRATRPADWLPMPEPQANEMYLLFHIPNGLSSLLAFTVTCSGSYTVALGTVTNGVFVQQSAASMASGVKYETELFANEFGNLTSDGIKQVMIKISGANILTWELSTHSKKTAPANYARWNIVEIACKLPNGTKVECGTSVSNKALANLRYFSWYGENAIIAANSMFQGCFTLIAVLQLYTGNATDMTDMFRTCYGLMAIPELDTSKVTNMTRTFFYCYSLTAIPQLNTGNVTTMLRTFAGCYSLRKIPQLNTENVTTMSNTFENCISLAAIPQIDTSKVTSMNAMFSSCVCLRTVPQIDTGKSGDMCNMFSQCTSLSKITFKPTVTGWAGPGSEISLANCSLSHQSIVDLFNSLPTITRSRELVLTGNPGAAELTAGEKAIATGRNWTLTL